MRVRREDRLAVDGFRRTNGPVVGGHRVREQIAELWREERATDVQSPNSGNEGLIEWRHEGGEDRLCERLALCRVMVTQKLSRQTFR